MDVFCLNVESSFQANLLRMVSEAIITSANAYNRYIYTTSWHPMNATHTHLTFPESLIYFMLLSQHVFLLPENGIVAVSLSTSSSLRFFSSNLATYHHYHQCHHVVVVLSCYCVEKCVTIVTRWKPAAGESNSKKFENIVACFALLLR